MKRVCIAAALLAAATSAQAQEPVLDRLEGLSERLNRVESLQKAETAGFYFGGSEACDLPLTVDDLGKVVPLPATDSEMYAAFVRGMVAANAQDSLNLPSKKSFCEQLNAYMTENGL